VRKNLPLLFDISIVAFIAIAIFSLVKEWVTIPSVKQLPIVTATIAPDVKDLPKVDIPIKSIKTYKPAIKAKLKLPDNIVQDALTSIQTKGDEHPHTITTTIDSTTGESSTFDRTDPLPWVAYDTHTEIGLFYGLKNANQAIRIEARQSLFQVKSVHAGAIASADMTQLGTDTFIGIGAWARW
jgi:hypothetical protein